MTINTLKIGDLIIRQKGPASAHYMVYVGWHNGIELVAENQTGHGVRFVSLQTALDGNPIKRLEPFGGKEHERELVIPKIRSLLGTNYNLINFNCEHFARLISNGTAESKQVKVASNIAIGGGLAMLTSKNKTVQGLGMLSLAAGVIGRISQL